MSVMLCTFRVGSQLYGVPVDQVQEVIRHQRPTPVPLAGGHIAGLINLRGSVVCGVCLRTRLGMEASNPPVSVVVRHGSGVAALMVDAIADVTVLDDDGFEPAPSTVPAATRDLLHGVYKLDGDLLCVLDVDLVVKGQ